MLIDWNRSLISTLCTNWWNDSNSTSQIDINKGRTTIQYDQIDGTIIRDYASWFQVTCKEFEMKIEIYSFMLIDWNWWVISTLCTNWWNDSKLTSQIDVNEGHTTIQYDQIDGTIISDYVNWF